MSDVFVHFSFGIAAHSCCSTTSGSSPSGDADAVRDAQHVAIDRQPGNAEGMAEDDVRRLAADAGQLGQFLHRPWNLAAVMFGDGPRHAESDFDFARKNPVDWICGSSSSVVAVASAFASG